MIAEPHGGTEAVVNLSQIPWVDPATLRRLLVKKYGSADKVPGTLVGTINDETSPEHSRAIRIWPPPSGEDGPARHLAAWQQEQRESEEELKSKGGLELDDDAGLSMFDD